MCNVWNWYLVVAFSQRLMKSDKFKKVGTLELSEQKQRHCLICWLSQICTISLLLDFSLVSIVFYNPCPVTMFLNDFRS